jgi:UDP-N-acetylmuramoyl-L-alanyl-D-glutamate--2,6-diaminopimelate ligase
MEPVKLKRLLKDIPGIQIRGSKEIEITGITSNSKLIAPGNLFIAKKGLTHDGARFIPDAIASGAIAFVTDIYDPFFPHSVQIITADIPLIEALLAQEFYQHAGRHLCLVGITGTNGKTTTSYLIKHLFDKMGCPFGLIGTIEWIVGGHLFPSGFTTPDVITNHKLFYEMVAEGCRGCVMEVSSHALEQQRVRRIDFDVAVFTNLTQDHLDYHQTMDAYAAAKALLFASLGKDKTAVINADSPYAALMRQECVSRVLTYGIESEADVRAEAISLTPTGTRCKICFQGTSYSLQSALIGRFNVYNLLAAIGAGLARSYPIEKILDALATFSTVQGRLERIENEKGLHLFVDYAHTEDALANVLTTLREINKKRIVTLFGCGGNRDKTKRPKMGAVVEALSDEIFVTSDNPRSEDPQEIITEILAGFREPKRAHVLVDREEAIRAAVHFCTPEDILLIAGKGHEAYQIFSHGTIAFDDRKMARAACQEKRT